MADVGQLHVKVGLDSTGFQNGIGKLNQEMRKVQSEFKLASSQMSKHGSGLDQLKVKSDSLTKQKEIQRQKVEALKAAHERSVETKGADAKATGDLEIKLNNAQAALEGMDQELANINREIEIQSSSWYELGQTLEPIGQKMQDVGKRMETIGQDLTKKVTLPIVGIGAAAVKIGSDFEAGMSQVQAISGASGDELDRLAEKAKEMGSSTKFSATESAEAMNYMAMAGWDTSQIMGGLDGVMMLASASGESLASVSDIVTDALTAFGMEASEAGDFADLLASASSNANTNVGMLGESFKYVAPLFGSLGYSSEDAALALGLMANAGIKGSQAGTSLRGAITRLTNPTGDAAALIEDLGIQMTDAQGNMLPFDEVIGQLRSSFGGLTEEQQAQYASTIFGREAMSGMLAIINATEDDYQSLTDATRDYNGAAGEMAEVMQDNLQGQLTILKSQLEGVAIEIFEILVPHLRTMVDYLQRAVEWFSNLNPGTQEAIVKVVALAAALGPVLLIGGKMVGTVGTLISLFSKFSLAMAGKTAAVGGAATATGGLVAVKGMLAAAFTALTGPIGIAVAAIVGITAVGVALWRNWDTVKEKAGELGQAVSERWSNLRERTSEAWGNMTENIRERWSDIGERTSESLSSMQDHMSTGWSNLQENTRERWAGIRENLSESWGSMWSNTTESLANIRERVGTSWQSVRDRTSSTWGELRSNTSSSWSDMQSSIDRHGGGIRGVIGSYTERYKSTWRNALGQMDTMTGGNFSNIRSHVSNAFSRINESIRDGINRVREWNSTSVKEKVFSITERVRNIFSSSGSVAKNFSGTSFFPGGMTMVGELGPELVELPRGSRIHNDVETSRMMNGENQANQGLSISIEQFVNNSDKDIEQLAYELEFYRQRMTQGRGRG
ncbi:phage tail tape measure protein [Salisediminibacterium selenitireducens]|uniref:Phage tail tape measure protein, TP901 family n=1 Tax=Bacillus selenitireducens (strain ATCC 700615 / DSM 15326 / MLS10) TaxID=439292 RepID=D6XZX6_BACIE|nr:phage tail tape measure protein [Salisediminibacterium selenitireducens]ADI00478.1 phage tail tape measure protein, TP901 family [[Bacillus] selenitireducens MLS10]